MTTLYLIIFINRHVIAQIVKAELIVRTIGNICCIHALTLLGRHVMNNQADLQSEEAVYLPHPLTVSLCQIIIDRNNVYALARQRIQIYRQRCHQCFTFTGLHFRDTSLVQNDATDQLYAVVPHTEHAVSRFAHGGKCLRQQVVQCFTILITLLKFCGLAAQFCIRQRTVFRLQCLYLVDNRIYLLQLMLRVRSEYFF